MRKLFKRELIAVVVQCTLVIKSYAALRDVHRLKPFNHIVRNGNGKIMLPRDFLCSTIDADGAIWQTEPLK